MLGFLLTIPSMKIDNGIKFMKRRIIACILTFLLMLWATDFYMQDKFDWHIFVVFLTLGGLACYKLVDYLARLKIVEKNSRIDIVFVTAVIAVMFVPVLKINHDKISVRENRTLAEYVPLVKDGKINFSYGRNFEEWFNDHFNGREYLIDLNAKLNLFMNRKLQSETALQGKENWLFTTRWNSTAMFQNKNLFSDKELSEIKNKMQAIKKWSEKHGIKFYVMLVPDKERLYGEFYPDGYAKENEISRLEQLTNYLQQNTDVNVIDIYKALLAQKSKYTLFYKTGTHWNLRGAFVGYQEMMKRLNSDFRDLNILQERDFVIENKREADVDIASALGVDAYKTFPDEDLTYEVFTVRNPKTKQDYQMLDKEKRIELYSYKSDDKAKHRKAVFFADSQFLRMNWYVAESFAEMLHIYVGYGRMYDLPFMSDEIVKFKPDIFVLETGERFLERLLEIDVPEE